MKGQTLFFSLLYLLMYCDISAQISLFPIERSEDYAYEKAMLRGAERVIFTRGLKQNYSFYIDVHSNDGGYLSIEPPKSISDWGQPFYYKKDSNNSITTGWIHPEPDSSFSIIMTQYDQLEKTHEIIQEERFPGVLGSALCTKIKKHKGQEYVILSISEWAGVADQIMFLRINESGMFFIQSLLFRPPGTIRGGIFILILIKEFDILNDERILLRGDIWSGIAMADFNLNIIDRKSSVYEDISRRIIYYCWNNSWVENGTKERWLFGFSSDIVRGRHDYCMIVYQIELDTIIIDTTYIYDNPENRDRAVGIGSSVKLGNNDVMLCANPYYGGIDWRTPIPSELYFKRIKDKEEIWHKKYQSEFYLRVLDMVLVDSCEVMIVGSIFDYFNNGYLQGFYATFDCDGNLITSNIELKEVDLNLYPNPNDGLFTVEIEDWKNLDYSVYNIDGKLIHSGLLDGQEADLSHLASGTYILKISTPDGIVNQKVVISN